MSSGVIDMNSVDDRDRDSPTAPRRTDLSYVLVADADLQRTAACLESIKAFNVGVLVARHGDEALGILQRFGPPILLITDLSLPRKDGFAVIEALRDLDGGTTPIIAWSALRELREFASHRLAGLNVRILNGAVAHGVLRGAIERALKDGVGTPRPSGSPPAPTVDEIHRTMSEAAARARELCATAGVAVYLKAPGQTQFRASVTWSSDAPIPDSLVHIPRVFDLVLESGEAVILPDLAMQPLSGVPQSTLQDAVRGLVAVPIVGSDEHVAGAICVFDVKPLDLGAGNVDALKALGQTALAELRSGEERAEGHDRRRSGAEPVSSRSDEPPERLSIDALSLLDRRVGDQAIARELARVRREQRQLSVILFDIDPVTRAAAVAATANGGPDPIDAVSGTLTKAIRASDLAIQWRRGELLVVLPGLNGTEARQVAERVRAAMQAGARHRVAVSGGVAELLTDETVESAIARANEKVRSARERGHNRVG